MIKKEIVCFIGLATTGKDYNSIALIENGFKKIALADPLRDMLYEILGFYPEKKSNGISYSEFKKGKLTIEKRSKIFGIIPWFEDVVVNTGRGLLQNIGSVMKKNFGENFWADLWCKSVLNSDYNVVCTDMRFTNEIKKALSLTRKKCRVTFIWTQYDGANYEKLLKDKHESEALSIFMYNNRDKYGLYDGKTLSHKLITQICNDFNESLK